MGKIKRVAAAGFYIPLAPPLTQKNFSHSYKVFCATYTRTAGFCLWANPDFQRMARQNPPVLLMLERLCSARKHPLSSVSGRQRYNTLDFADKVVCHETAGFIGFFLPRQRRRLWKPLPTGHSRPYWKPRAKGKSHPFGIPDAF